MLFIWIATPLCPVLRQKLLRGEYLLAADEFPKWVHARSIRLQGLVRRRLLEREVFLQGIS
ncbi:glycoside hydrolase family protein [Candidatus Tisiphia endosymbiont of Thecophora atra]|uniref:glycoside hydrolase family protein n=1 Tax=Candidatus Tisiphia endosymbiont of Thecophora atra TaxID=3066258 RepID=UPI003977AF2D